MKALFALLILLGSVYTFTDCTDDPLENNKWLKSDSIFSSLEEALNQAENCRTLILRNQLPTGYAIQQAKTIDERIGQLINLQSLHIYGLAQTELPAALSQLAHLKTIEIRGTTAASIRLTNAESLCSSSSLQHLSLSDCQLTSYSCLPPSLVSLDLSSNQLQRINLSNHPKLCQINLENNNLESLSIQDIPHLNRLNVAENNLHRLDSQLWILPQLNWISLSQNPIEELMVPLQIQAPLGLIAAIGIHPLTVRPLIRTTSKHVWLSSNPNDTPAQWEADFPNARFIWFQKI